MSPAPENKKCEWEQCTEVATHRVAWSTLKPPNGEVFSDLRLREEHAVYCDPHTELARQLGAKHLEWFDRPQIEGKR